MRGGRSQTSCSEKSTGGEKGANRLVPALGKEYGLGTRRIVEGNACREDGLGLSPDGDARSLRAYCEGLMYRWIIDGLKTTPEEKV